MSITIRPLQTPEAYLAAEYLERTIWGRSEAMGRLVVNTINWSVPDERYVLLGAFDETRSSSPPSVPTAIGSADPTLVGFLCSSPVTDPKPAQYVNIVGVLPAYQNRGIGYQLFLALREQLLMRRRETRTWSVDQVTWTYDPMLSRHAFLYLHKLGGTACTYIPNCYGEMNDLFNAGLPSDRLSVTWMITESSVEKRIAGTHPTVSRSQLYRAGVPILNPTPPTSSVAPLGPEPALLRNRQVLIQIPRDFHRIKATNLALARRWQQQIRIHFRAAFAEGFVATDVIRSDRVMSGDTPTDDHLRNNDADHTWYLLERVGRN